MAEGAGVGKLCGFLWDCLWWPINTSLEVGVLEAQEGAVVGVLPSGILNDFSSHTPVTGN